MANEFKWYAIAHTKLNEEVVLKMIECGMHLYTIEQSCRICDITTKTYYAWMKKARLEIEEFDEVRTPLLKRFYNAHEKGRTMVLEKISEKVINDSMVDSDLGLKVLERHLDQWSNKTKSTLDIKSDAVVRHDFTGLSAEEKREMIKQIIAKDSGSNEPVN